MSGTQALERGFDILSVLAQKETGIFASQIADEISVSTSTVYRLLRALERRGLVWRQVRGQVGLGPALLDLARAAHRHIGGDLSSVALPHMRNLTKRTGETALLTAASGMHTVCIEAVESQKAVRLSYEKGRVFSLHAGASAVALLAHLEDDLVARVVAANEGTAYAHGGLVTRESLVKSLDKIREQGYATSTGEVDSDVSAIAAPIFSRQNRVIASLTLAGPKDRFLDSNLPMLTKEVVETAQAIMSQLHRVDVVLVLALEDAPEGNER